MYDKDVISMKVAEKTERMIRSLVKSTGDPKSVLLGIQKAIIGNNELLSGIGLSQDILDDRFVWQRPD